MDRPPRPIHSKRWICVISPDDEQNFRNIPIGYQCTGLHKHPHYTRNRVQKLVDSGVMKWVGRHFRVATWLSARTWQKAQSVERDEQGKVIASVATMQLKPGAGR